MCAPSGRAIASTGRRGSATQWRVWAGAAGLTVASQDLVAGSSLHSRRRRWAGAEALSWDRNVV